MKYLHLAALAALLCACTSTQPIAATSNPIGPKIGRATEHAVFGLSFGGDASIRAAAKDGGITRVSTVDLRITNALGIFVTRTVTVTGE